MKTKSVAGGRRFKSRHPTSAEIRMWGRRLAAMLALYTGKGVTPEVNLREHISCTPPHSSNKAEPTLALKPRGDVTRSPKQGYQWPHKWTCVLQNFFFLKKKKRRLNLYPRRVPSHFQLSANVESSFKWEKVSRDFNHASFQ